MKTFLFVTAAITVSNALVEALITPLQNVCTHGSTSKSVSSLAQKTTSLCAIPPDLSLISQTDVLAVQRVTESMPLILNSFTELINNPEQFSIDSYTVQSQVETFTAINVYAVNAIIGLSAFLLGNVLPKKRTMELESTVNGLKTQLRESEKSGEDLKNKISHYEDQIFQLENDYEIETGELKKEFQATLEKEKDKERKKVKNEMAFSMKIQMDKERSQMTQEKLEFMEKESFGKSAEFAAVRLEKLRLEQENKNMQRSLADYEAERDSLTSKKKNGIRNFVSNVLSP